MANVTCKRIDIRLLKVRFRDEFTAQELRRKSWKNVNCTFLVSVPDIHTGKRTRIEFLTRRPMPKGKNAKAELLTWALMDVIEHEVKESMMLDGKRVLNPHKKRK